MEDFKHIDTNVLNRLKAYRDRMTVQQYRTLKGQALAGNGEAALNGLQKVLSRNGKEESRCRKSATS